MKRGFYPITSKGLRKTVQEIIPTVKPERGLNKNLFNHLFWMLDEVDKMEDAEKAGRWIGYVIGRVESIGILENERSRDLVRRDMQKRHKKK